MTRKLFAAALTASAIIATPAMADTADGMSIEVRYDDLNLSTAIGQNMLERRLVEAAEKACGIDRRVSGWMPTVEKRNCFREASKSFDNEIAVRVQEQQARRG